MTRFLLAFALLQILPTFEFDVASVKPVKDSTHGQRFRNTKGSLEVRNMEPTTMIRNAYSLVMEGSLTGAPSWADSECFDIEARADEDQAIDLVEARKRNLLRLQTLLADRFQLKAHWQSQIQKAYVLTADKGGSKLKASQPGTVHRTQQGRGILLCAACSVPTLASFLSNFLGKPIQDQTGIQGFYDINLSFQPLDPDLTIASQQPSLFTVLNDQLGLKLEPRKIPVQVLVIDHIEHPSAN